jgi:coenzyme F420-reducing hydrogenase delta subunit
MLTKDTERPVVGFYCRECASVAISLSGMRRDNYPARVRLMELPCLGRISALHIVEAARLGASGIFLAGCAKGRCQFRKGDRNAENQVRIAQDLLHSLGITLPIELWRLCAVDRHSVGRRIRLFCATTEGSGKYRLSIDKETKKILETMIGYTAIAPDLIKGTSDEQKLP